MKITIKNLSNNPKRIFLMDSIGAFLSAMFLFTILSLFTKEFGVPKKTIYLLLGVACIFSIYSFCCFCFFGKQWKVLLRTILIANLFYCLLTIILLAISGNTVTLLALIYFILELILIVCIALIELKEVNNNHI